MSITEYNLYMYIYDEYKRFSEYFTDVNDFVYKNRFSVMIDYYNSNIKDNNDYYKNVNYEYYKKFNVNTIEMIETKYKDNYAPKFRILLCKSEYENYGLHRYGWKYVIQNFLEKSYIENCFVNDFYYKNPNFEWLSYALLSDCYDYESSINHFILHSSKECKYNKMKAIIFDDWLEKTYTWHKNNKDIKKDYNINFISFIHDPPMINITNDNDLIEKNIKLKNKEIIEKNENFLKEKQKLKILITLSTFHKSYLLQNVSLHENTVIKSLFHPLEINLTINKGGFDIKEYLLNNNKKLYISGWWLRKYDVFLKLSTEKVIIIKSNEGIHVQNYIYKELINLISKEQNLNKTQERLNEDLEILNKTPNSLNDKYISILKNTYNTEMIYNLDESNYDNIFKNNIMFLDLYDSTANNFLLESIMNNTPILINWNHSIIEYLGEDYPFYFTNYLDAQYKLHNVEVILNTHLYLKNMDKTKFTYNYFNKELKKIIMDNI